MLIHSLIFKKDKDIDSSMLKILVANMIWLALCLIFIHIMVQKVAEVFLKLYRFGEEKKSGDAE